MRVLPCRPYHSRTDDVRLVRMPDGLSVFKLYAVSIIGRDDPAKFEWNMGALTLEDFVTQFRQSGLTGVGFVTAFPHIVKVFRFAPAMETVLHVQAFHTADLSPLDLTRDDGYVEFACYAEAAIAADEYHAWAQAATVEAYLEARSAFIDGPVAERGKLAAYVDAAPSAG